MIEPGDPCVHQAKYEVGEQSGTATPAFPDKFHSTHEIYKVLLKRSEAFEVEMFDPDFKVPSRNVRPTTATLRLSFSVKRIIFEI